MIFNKGKSQDGDVARNTYSWPLEYKGENILYRLPTNVQWNDNIVVNEDEYAVFFRDGKAMHVFDRAGRYALTTTNVPILGKLGAKVTGIRQLGEVYYVQRRELRGKFGTKEPLAFRDTDFGVVRIRMFGQFAYKVTDPILFITQFVGTNGWSQSENIINWLKDELVQVLNDALGEIKRDKGMGVVDLPAYMQEIEQMLLAKVAPEVQRYGLKITNLAGLYLNLPPEVQEGIDKRGAMGALGVNYLQYQTGKAIEGVGEGAAQGGGGGGAAMFAGMGAGFGAGAGMAGAMTTGMSSQGGTPQFGAGQNCPKCNKPLPANSRFCPECGAKFVPGGGKAPCPKCGKDIETGAKFCPDCGAKLSGSCPKCGKDVPAGAKFCPECGGLMA